MGLSMRTEFSINSSIGKSPIFFNMVAICTVVFFLMSYTSAKIDKFLDY